MAERMARTDSTLYKYMDIEKELTGIITAEQKKSPATLTVKNCLPIDRKSGS